MAVQIFSGLGQWWHAEGTLFNSNRSCGAQQFDINLLQQCFCHVGRRPKQSRHTTTHLEHRGEQATVSGQSLKPTTVPWTRAIFGPNFVHVAHNSQGNCWRDTQTLGWRHGGLASMAFSWTNFRIEKNPAQVTMLHAGIFPAIPLLSMRWPLQQHFAFDAMPGELYFRSASRQACPQAGCLHWLHPTQQLKHWNHANCFSGILNMGSFYEWALFKGVLVDEFTGASGVSIPTFLRNLNYVVTCDWLQALHWAFGLWAGWSLQPLIALDARCALISLRWTGMSSRMSASVSWPALNMGGFRDWTPQRISWWMHRLHRCLW